MEHETRKAEQETRNTKHETRSYLTINQHERIQ